MLGKRGLYEIFLGFFAVVVIIFVVIFFIYASTESASLYGALRKASSSQSDAGLVKDSLMSCHRLDYLVEAKLGEPCPADELLKGYGIFQLPLNGCSEKHWDFSRGQYSQLTPFYVTIAQADSGVKCLARLEVYS